MRWAHLLLHLCLNADSYRFQTSGLCSDVITSISECQSAASEMSADPLNDITDTAATSANNNGLPYGCFWATAEAPEHRLNFNLRSYSTVNCDSTYTCICRQSLVATTTAVPTPAPTPTTAMPTAATTAAGPTTTSPGADPTTTSPGAADPTTTSPGAGFVDTTVAAHGGPVDAALAAAVADEEQRLLTALGPGDGSATLTGAVPGAVIVARRMDLSEVSAAGGALTVPVEEQSRSAAVRVPASLVATMGGSSTIIVITAYSSTISAAGASSEQESINGLVSVNMYTNYSSLAAAELVGLVDPIELAMGVNASTSAQCVFWDESQGVWSAAGLQRSGGGPDNPLVCMSTHLTLFAIVEGFVSALLCSQLAVLSQEGLARLIESNWILREDGWFLVVMLLMTCSWVIVAACLECRWQEKGLRDDTIFFIGSQADDEGDEGTNSASQVGAGEEDQGDAGGDVDGGDGGGAGGVFAAVCVRCALYLSCRRFVADKAKVEADPDAPAKPPLWQRVLAQLHITMVHCQVSASLLMSREDVKLMFERARLKEAEKVREEQLATTKSPESMWPWANPKAEPEPDPPENGSLTKGLMDVLQLSVVDGIQEHKHGERIMITKLPLQFVRLFIAKCPFCTSLCYSLRLPATLGTLLLQAEVLTAAMFVAAFFQASGGAYEVTSDPACTQEGIWAELGRLIAVGIVSAIGALIPAIIVKKIHKRHFMVIKRTKGKDRQLRSWRNRDRALTVFVVTYSLFALLFIAAFLSNVTPHDGKRWLVAVIMGFAKKALVVPLLWAAGMLLLILLTFFVGSVRELAHQGLDHSAVGAKGEPIIAATDLSEATQAASGTPSKPSQGKARQPVCVDVASAGEAQKERAPSAGWCSSGLMCGCSS